MSKRLPRPKNPKRQRCELDEDELRAVEDAAHACRLSVASFIRVALIEAAAHLGRVDAWKVIADRIVKEAEDAGVARPGRPKDDADKPKKGKK